MPKRKASESGNSLDLGLGPKPLSEALHALLGAAATDQTKQFKNLERAVALLKKKLRAQGDVALKYATVAGITAPIRLGASLLPSVAFEHVLGYARSPAFPRAAATCRAWLAALECPRLWKDAFDASRHSCIRRHTRLSLKELAAVLSRPRHGLVATLRLPYGVKLGKTGAAALARAVPGLAAVDFGFTADKLHPSNACLVALANECERLTSMRCDMWNVSSPGLAAFAGVMGGRLEDLRVQEDTICNHYFCDGACAALARACPNLKRLTVLGGEYSHYYKSELDNFTVHGFSTLLDGCDAVERLDIFKNISVRSLCDAIAERKEAGKLGRLRGLNVDVATVHFDYPRFKELKDRLSNLGVVLAMYTRRGNRSLHWPWDESSMAITPGEDDAT